MLRPLGVGVVAIVVVLVVQATHCIRNGGGVGRKEIRGAEGIMIDDVDSRSIDNVRYYLRARISINCRTFWVLAMVHLLDFHDKKAFVSSFCIGLLSLG